MAFAAKIYTSRILSQQIHMHEQIIKDSLRTILRLKTNSILQMKMSFTWKITSAAFPCFQAKKYTRF